MYPVDDPDAPLIPDSTAGRYIGCVAPPRDDMGTKKERGAPSGAPLPFLPARQKATTPSTMKPWNLPPARMSLVGKASECWRTNSIFESTFGVTNQPPPTCERFTVMSFLIPASWPLTAL